MEFGEDTGDISDLGCVSNAMQWDRINSFWHSCYIREMVLIRCIKNGATG